MNKERHKNWVRDVLKINDKVRREMEMFSKGKTESVSEVSSETIELLLKHSLDDIEAYVPPRIIRKMCDQNLPITWPDEKLSNLAVNFATRQILEEIENPEVQRIRVFEGDGIRVMSAVKGLPQIRKRFDIVIQVDTSSGIEENIAIQLGFSPNRGKLNEFLKTKSFLIFLDDGFGWTDLYEVGKEWWNSNNIQKIVCITRDQGIYSPTMTEDLLINLNDHLLPWQLFCLNFGKNVHLSCFQHKAIDVVEKCCGHLLAVVLMARALERVQFDFSVWEHACYMLSLQHNRSQMVDRVLCNTLAFILGRLSDSTHECLKYCAFFMERKEMDKVDLIQQWIKHALISKFDEGEKIVGDLASAFLLESSENGSSVRIREEIREVIVNSLFLLRGGRGLTKEPSDVEWEELFEIQLMNNKFSKLPNSPNCPQLCTLFLQNNRFLRAIPPLFFQHMPILQILDLSHTKIRSLPHSLFGLAQLKTLLLRGCKLLMELPPEVGELHNLKVLDFEGTEIIRLPVEVGKLTNLTSLKMSFYGDTDDRWKDDQYYSSRIIPQNVMCNLLQLEELIIDVSPDDKRWNSNVKDIVEEVCQLDRLNTLQIYLPEVLLLNVLWKNASSSSSSANISGMHFRFTVGSHMKRIISRVPLDVAAKFGEQERYLKYVNGEYFQIEIEKILEEATALFLDRHSTATSLSEFGLGTMKNLKCCILAECDEIQAIVDADFNRYLSLELLEYLNVYYMKNLKSMWKGKFQRGALSCLKVLVLYTCPQLTTIFTSNMIFSLRNLEELVVEDCPKIESLIVIHNPNSAKSMLKLPMLKKMSLPKLKKLSLHYLPRLVSIFDGLIIPPKLEWMSLYDCPNLKTLYPEEVQSKDLRTITGEAKWWEELKWNDSESFGPPNMDAIFVPIYWDKDLTTQLAEINVQHQARM